jgi:hypothetical protein
MSHQPQGIHQKRICLEILSSKQLEVYSFNNLLKHLARIIIPWINILAGRLKKGDCTLLMTDSLTSEGWLRKSNFIKDSKDPIQTTIRLKVAPNHASQYLLNKIWEYSQWFPGAANNISDALSWDGDRSNVELTQMLHYLYPFQLPQHFKLYHYPTR